MIQVCIDQNILPCIGATILEESAAPRETFPVRRLLPTVSKALKCTESSRILELFQVYLRCFFVSQMKNTCKS